MSAQSEPRIRVELNSLKEARMHGVQVTHQLSDQNIGHTVRPPKCYNSYEPNFIHTVSIGIMLPIRSEQLQDYDLSPLIADQLYP